jgi:hypothetical protein
MQRQGRRAAVGRASSDFSLSDIKDLGAASTGAAGPDIDMHMLTSTHAALRHPTSTNPPRPGDDASKAAQPTGLTTAELRRIILDLIG